MCHVSVRYHLSSCIVLNSTFYRDLIVFKVADKVMSDSEGSASEFSDDDEEGDSYTRPSNPFNDDEAEEAGVS